MDEHSIQVEGLLCQAIRERRVVRFHYEPEIGDAGIRVVEPHQTGENVRGNEALSAWFLRGESTSDEGEGWREYLYEMMSNVTILEETFPGPRRFYNPTSDKIFRNARCSL